MTGERCEQHPWDWVDDEDGTCPSCRYFARMWAAAADAFERATPQAGDTRPEEPS